jgi:aminobenzoyl-glutamate utilization protein B
MHYVITAGGSAPNVIPDFAEVFYYMRNPDPAIVKDSFDRLVKAAEGAALGTGTTVEYEVIHGINSLLPNRYLQNIVHANLTKVGGVGYSPTERAFAQKLMPSLGTKRTVADAATIDPLSESQGFGSTDVGDVSYNVPTAGFSTATWVPGTPAHSWQAVAAGGTSIATKGMQNAAKVLALTAIELFQNPDHIAAAKAEFNERRGPNFVYEPLLGNRKPPLDYRVNKTGSE